MRQFLTGLVLFSAFLTPTFSKQNNNPFIGRWDFNITTPTGMRASWLGVTDKNGALDVWFQPTGGNVREVKDFKLDGSHLSLNLSQPTGTRPGMTWELEAAGDKLTGVQKVGDNSTPLTGVRAPKLSRRAPASWTAPEPLFNGKNLDGWEPIGDVANNHWTVKDGLLVNEAHGANLRTTCEFTDFKVHFEVNCPDDANSGFYLRGRYEVQLEYEPLTKNPPERRIGSIYGRIAPSTDLPRTPGKWETFDITLVGRTVTVVRDGVTIIDHKEIEGITGGAIDANEGEPGPFYIQGDHTGGLQFRNITVSVPKG
ncbi:MAG: DUF1080 domain-containing protein [Acidobacteriaceae bacterium]|nr:DUF1080 domain-containing protein [Acidobacteriaceae bacterium]